jgi:hypothetical protein
MLAVHQPGGSSIIVRRLASGDLRCCLVLRRGHYAKTQLNK